MADEYLVSNQRCYPDYASLVAVILPHPLPVTYQPLQHFIPARGSAFPDHFAGIAIQSSCLHRLHPRFGIRENLVHSCRNPITSAECSGAKVINL